MKSNTPPLGTRGEWKYNQDQPCIINDSQSNKIATQDCILGQCLPITTTMPSYAINPQKLSQKIQYMINHALIGNFMGIWPSKKALIWWINTKWKTTGHTKLKLGLKGLCTVIFHNLVDWEQVFENGPYFFNFVGLSDSGLNDSSWKRKPSLLL